MTGGGASTTRLARMASGDTHDVAVPRLGVATGLDVVVRAYGHGSRAPGRPGSGGLLGYRAPELVGVLEGVERGR